MAELPPILPRSPWTERADLAALAAALGSENVRWVGGAVRDTLLEAPVKDVDAATVLQPAETMTSLERAGIRALPTGFEHGTVTAVLPGGNVEVTTLRHDVSTDGRRATVAFATNWREDAARRDFTINALYADPVTRQIFDYFGGLDDLAERRVRFIGDARERIREDHLRILRYYRFQTRFAGELDPEAEQACAELAPMLKGISRERVAMELLNWLALPDPSATAARMAKRGVMTVILPECDDAGIAALAALVAEEQRQDAAPSALRRLAALLPPDPRLAEQAAARLRLSNAHRKRLMAVAERNHPPGSAQEDPRALAYRVGPTVAIDRLLLAGRSIASLIGWDIPQLPLKGGEIVARGIGAGPEVARTLREVEERWAAEGFPGRERVLAILDSVLQDRVRGS